MACALPTSLYGIMSVFVALNLYAKYGADTSTKKSPKLSASFVLFRVNKVSAWLLSSPRIKKKNFPEDGAADLRKGSNSL